MEQERIYGLAEVVMSRYYDYYPDRSTEWVGREIDFRIPNTLPDGRKPTLVGKIDGAFVDKRGYVWLKEIKTKGRVSMPQIKLLVPLDLQCNYYVYALKKHLRKIKVKNRNFKDINPKGILYDIIRRPADQKVAESLTEYLDRVAADVDKRPDFYFQHHEEPIDKKHTDRYYANWIEPVLMDVCDWWEGKTRHYPNPDGLLTMYGVSDLCTMMSTGNTDGWQQVDTVNEELTSPL